MKVLHVAPWFFPAHFYGGPIQSVYSLCRHLVRQGAQVRVLTTDANGPDRIVDVDRGREIELSDGVRVRFCRRFGPEAYSPELLFRLPTYVAWADVVHLMPVYSFPTIPTLVSARLLGRPVVWSPRGGLTSWDGRRRKRLKHLWELVCKVAMPGRLAFHATSPMEQMDCRTRFPGCDAVVIPNGVEAADAAGDPGASSRLRILYLGRLHPSKGIVNLIEACGELNAPRNCREALDLSLTIVGTGDPEYRRLLNWAIRSAALEGRVHMPGQLTGQEREHAFANSDVLVLPSYSENFGMVIAEALARGVPVIASRRTPWQRVEEVGCGLWVDNDAASLAASIRRIARMPIAEMGRRGRVWMRTEFRWETIASRMLQTYGELTGTELQPVESTRVAHTAAG